MDIELEIGERLFRQFGGYLGLESGLTVEPDLRTNGPIAAVNQALRFRYGPNHPEVAIAERGLTAIAERLPDAVVWIQAFGIGALKLDRKLTHSDSARRTIENCKTIWKSLRAELD
jgi:hypothetical protein